MVMGDLLQVSEKDTLKDKNFTFNGGFKSDPTAQYSTLPTRLVNEEIELISRYHQTYLKVPRYLFLIYMKILPTFLMIIVRTMKCLMDGEKSLF